MNNEAAAVRAAADDDIPEIELNVPSQFVQELERDRHGVDPRLVRWGYNPGLRGVHLSPTRTGFQTAHVPIATFFEHRTFQTPQENFTIDENKEKEFLRDVTAAESEIEVLNALGHAGYQILFVGLRDRATVKVVERTLLPKLSFIRELFQDDSPVPAECPFTDEMDLGEPREYCARCHLDWIRSDQCLQYMQLVASEGKLVAVPEPQAGGGYILRNVTVKPTLDQLVEGREAVIKGLESYIRFAAKEWRQTVAEIDNEKRNEILDQEHMLRKDIHAYAPKEKELAMVREIAGSVRDQRSVPAQAVDNAPVVKAIKDMQAENREFFAQQAEANRQFMAGLFASVQPANSPAPAVGEQTAESADKNTKGVKK